MKVGDLWRTKYDALLRENVKLKERIMLLSKQLIGTIAVLIIVFVYSLFKSIS